MAQLINNNIKIFPYSGDRGESDPYSADLNERNLIILSTASVDTDSYVISYDDNIIKFVLAGYYIDANISGLNLSNLYAYLTLTTDPKYPTIHSAEDSEDGKFAAVVFINSTEEPTDGTRRIHLLDSNGKVPETSWQKIDRASLNLYWKNL